MLQATLPYGILCTITLPSCDGGGAFDSLEGTPLCVRPPTKPDGVPGLVVTSYSQLITLPLVFWDDPGKCARAVVPVVGAENKPTPLTFVAEALRGDAYLWLRYEKPPKKGESQGEVSERVVKPCNITSKSGTTYLQALDPRDGVVKSFILARARTVRYAMDDEIEQTWHAVFEDVLAKTGDGWQERAALLLRVADANAGDRRCLSLLLEWLRPIVDCADNSEVLELISCVGNLLTALDATAPVAADPALF